MALAGFNRWNPTAEQRVLLSDIREVFGRYKDYLPLTGRQIFYVLIGGDYGYPKTEAFANRLYKVLGRARRSGRLPFHWMRDDGGRVATPQTFADEAGFWDSVRDDFKHYSRERQTGQEVYVELFCEAPGMMPQLQRAAFPYSVPVYGTRGYTGLAVVGEVVRRALMRDMPTTILQIGDLDPSGVGIYETLRDDVEAFMQQAVEMVARDEPRFDTFVQNLGIDQERCDAIRALDQLPGMGFERIALTWDQVAEYDLETAPPKASDSRSANWPYDDTAQAEALPPDILQQVVREGIEAQFDMKVYWAEVEREEADKDAIGDKLANV